MSNLQRIRSSPENRKIAGQSFGDTMSVQSLADYSLRGNLAICCIDVDYAIGVVQCAK
ncbi:hypothetical protein RGU77_12855 [Actimicrobium sp. CCI2.3]|uniref:hypothetical protein n=1 Tax=Actimicrobium sp. CCI2.3 TaxID=3048616 RepID=UPI002AB3567B|nr:hypothetical protein [Actimicrobium sp. CCI2.3]MDY7575162.1 hypothetical protein [Actimicrobium sp. CCI2.3]